MTEAQRVECTLRVERQIHSLRRSVFAAGTAAFVVLCAATVACGIIASQNRADLIEHVRKSGAVQSRHGAQLDSLLSGRVRR